MQTIRLPEPAAAAAAVPDKYDDDKASNNSALHVYQVLKYSVWDRHVLIVILFRQKPVFMTHTHTHTHTHKPSLYCYTSM